MKHVIVVMVILLLGIPTFGVIPEKDWEKVFDSCSNGKLNKNLLKDGTH